MNVRLLASLFLIFSSVGVFANSGNFTYQGQIVKPNGFALENNNVTFTVEVVSPAPSSCILYRERHSRNMTGSNGIFSLEVGDGTRTGSGDYSDNPINTLANAVNNSAGTLNSLTCAVGNSYTPASGDVRQLRVMFNDGSGPNVVAQNHTIHSVPFAQSANTIDGITSDQLLLERTDAGNELSQANLENIFTTANHAELLSLLNGTSSTYLASIPSADFDMNTNKIINVDDPVNAGDAANKNYVDSNIGGSVANASLATLAAGQAGQVLTWDGAQWTVTTPSTNDTTKLPLAGGTMTGTINMNSQDLTGANDITSATVTTTGAVDAGTTLSSGTTLTVGTDASVGGNATITGNTGVGGNANIGGDANVTGNVVVTGGIGVATGINSDGAISLHNEEALQFGSGAFGATSYVGFKAPAGLITDTIWTLPATDGIAGEVLVTDGSGVLSWVDPTSLGSVSSVFGRTGAVVANAGDYTASEVTNVAAGNIAAVTVQGAIDELDTEKVATTRSVSTGSGLTGGGDLSADRTLSVDIAGTTLLGAAVDNTDTLLVYDSSGTVLRQATRAELVLSEAEVDAYVSDNGYASQTDMDAAEADIATLQTDVGTLQTDVGTLQTDMTAAQADITALETDMTTAQGDITTLQSDVTALDSAKVNRAGDSMTGALQLSAQNELRFADSDSSNYVGFTAPAVVAGNIVWELPAVDGAAGEVLSTDGSGVLSWVDPTSLGSVSSVFGRTGAVVATAGDYTASEVTNVAAGNIAAVTVQAAIDELDTEKVDGGRSVTAGAGLTGGGDLTSDRTFDVGAGAGIAVAADSVSVNIAGTTLLGAAVDNADTVLIYDSSGAVLRQATRAELVLSEAEVDAYVSDNGYALQTDMDAAEADIATLQTDVGTLQTDMTAAQADITTLQSDMTTAQSDITTLQSDVTALDSAKVDRTGDTMTGSLMIGATNELRMGDSDSSNYVGFVAPAVVTGNVVWELPAVDGAAGEVLATDGSGVLSWVDPTSVGAVSSVFGRTGAVVATAGDYTASEVTNVAAGNIAAVTVQAAINELDTEKVATTRSVSTGSGLTGGGDLSADRTLSVDIAGTTLLGAAVDNTDTVLIYDSSGTVLRQATRAELVLSEAEVDAYVGDNGYALQTDMDAAEADIATLQSDMTTAQADITALETDMTTAQSDITTLQSDVTALDSAKVERAGDSMTGALQLNAQNELRLADSDSSNYVGLRSPATVGTNYTFTLPDTPGTSGQVLETDGTGVMTWRTLSAVGETNTASNQGSAGVGVFDNKNGVDLEFRNVVAGSTKVGVTLDAGNKNIEIDVNEANLDAGLIPNTATGNIAATNVQAAVDELDTEKVAKAGDTMTGSLMIGATNEIRLGDADSSNYVGFVAPAVLGGNLIWELPGADGASGEVLSTDGSGALSWVSPTSLGAVSSVFGRTGAVVATAGDYTASEVTNVAAGNIAAVTVQAAIDELDSEKVDGGRSVTAGAGLTGGGDLTSDRTFDVGAGAGIAVAADSVSVDIAGTTLLGAAVDNADTLLVYDSSGTVLRQATRAELVLSEAEVDAYVSDNGYALQTDMDAAEADIATLQSDMTTAQTDITALETDMATAQSDITTLQSDVTALDSAKVERAGDSMTGALQLNAQNELRLADSDSSNYVGLRSPATVGTNYTFTLPDTPGTSGQVLETDGTGVMTWRTLSAVGESNTASNQGSAGVGVFDNKNGIELEFRNITAGSTKVGVTLDAGNKNIEIDVNEANLDAGVIPNTAAGNIAATNVQAAIDELDTEKVAKAGDTMTGSLMIGATNEIRLGDADSSNYVGFVAPAVLGGNLIWELPGTDGASGEVLSTDGSGALSWVSPTSLGAVSSVFGRTGAVVATSGDYTASEVTNVAAGNIAAVTVQAAIDELDTEKVATTRSVSAGSGLTGGGDLSADRTLSVDIAGTTLLGAAVDNADTVLVYDSSGTVLRQATRAELVLSEAEVDAYVGDNGYALQTDMDAAEADIATLQSDMTTAQADITALESDMATAQSDITTLQSDVTALDSAKVERAGDSMTGALQLNAQNELRLADSDSSNYVGLRSPATVGTNYTFTLPDTPGTSGQVLETDGTGVMTWRTLSAVGESNTASNQGSAGVGVFDNKNGIDLEFRNITAGSTKVGVSLDAGNKNIEIDVNEANLDAGTIPNTAAGNIVATNIQAAIDELDTEKVAKAGDTMTGSLMIGASNEIRLGDADSSNYVGFVAPAVLGGNLIWELPGADGASGEVLSTDGSGALSWVSPTSLGAVSSVFGRTGAVVATAGDYTASEVTNVAAGNIAAVTVQAAIDELDTEKVATTRSVSTGSGLTGGGDLSADRTLSVDIAGTTLLGAAVDNADTVLIYDSSGTALRQATRAELVLSEAEVDAYVSDNGYALQTDMDAAEADIATLQSDMTTAQADITALDSAKVERAGDSMTGALQLNAQNELRLADSDSSNYVGLRSPATVGTNYTFTLPNTPGTSGQVLETDGTGVMTWRTLSAVGESNTASNQGSAGVGVFDNKNGVDLEFRNIVAGSTKVGVSLDAGNKNIEIDVNEANLDAGVIPNTAAGNITATNVQAAIDELDTEKVAKAGDTMTGSLMIGATSEIRLGDADSSNYVGFVSPSVVAGNIVWELPAADGTAGQVLTTDGSGALTWEDATSAAPVDSVFGRTGVVVAAAGDYTAAQVTNVAAGNIAATTVQAAINELDTEKVGTARTITAGAGLTGGGDLSADRTLDIGAGTGIAVAADAISVDIASVANKAGAAVAADSLLIVDSEDTNALKEITRANFLSGYLAANIGTSAGDVMGADAVPHCDPDEKLEMSAGPTYAWSCVADAGGAGDFLADGTVAMTGAFRGATGSAASPSITFSADSDTGFYNMGGDGWMALSTQGSDMAWFSPAYTVWKKDFQIDYSSNYVYSSSGATTTPGMSSLSIINGDGTTNSSSGLSLRTRGGGNNQGAYLAAVSNGSGTTPTIVIGQQTAASAYTERMRIDTSGNVGIGTTSPSAQLHVRSDVAGAEGGSLVIENRTGASVGTQAGLYLVPNNAGGKTRAASIVARQTTSGNYADLGFFTAAGAVPTEKMTITTSGNVGIGVLAPVSALEVSGQIRNTASVSNGTSTVSFSTGNMQYTTSNCGAFNLHYLRDGGVYNFVVKGTTSATCSFNAYSDAGSTALTVHMPKGHGATVTGQHTVYSIMVVGTDAYLSWVNEFD